MPKSSENKTRDAERAEYRRLALANAEAMSGDEDARLTAAAESDPDALPIAEGQRFEPLPLEQHLERMRRRPGQRGPQKAPTKQLVSLRLDPDVLQHFQGSGSGWQTRINDALRKAAGLG